MASIYLLTVNYHASALIERLIQSLRAESDIITYEVVIINNSPDDGKIQNLSDKSVQIIEAKTNLGFGKACNLGLNWIYEQNPHSLVWLINPDAYILPDSLLKVNQFFTDYPEVSILGTEVYEPTGEIWFGSGKFVKETGLIVVEKESLNYGNSPYLSTDWVTGCSLVVNLSNFSECPQFAPEYFLYYEDCDFCLRYAEQGHIVGITNQIKIIHEPSSITLRYGYLRLTHNIYSYLLSLEKHSSKLVLVSRLLRMVFMAIIVLPFKPMFSLSKLKGVFMYLSRK
jgi:GT2 family glycosyltransferase